MISRSEAVQESDILYLISLLAPDDDVLPEEVAQWLLSIKFSDEQKAYMVELADRGNQGVLTEEERDEAHRLARVGTALSILHSKARLALRKSVQPE